MLVTISHDRYNFFYLISFFIVVSTLLLCRDGCCGVLLRDRKRTAEFMDCLGVVSVEDVVSHGRFKQDGHVERKGN